MRGYRQKGFTIVELLIVIVIIGILATIVIVAYNGITAKAHASTLQSDLSNASRLLEMAKVSSMNYPDDLSTVKNGAPLTASKDNKFAYNVSADKSSYCLAASYPTTNPTMTLVVTEKNGIPVAGDCSGAIAIPPCTTDTYAIGATGPGGGKVFYDKGSCSGGWRYMEVYTSNWTSLGPNTPWCDSVSIVSTQTGIGTGKSNTEKMRAACSSSIAKLLIDYTVGGKSDWFIPSRDELALVYGQHSILGTVCGGDNEFWSSSEYDSTYAYVYATSPGSPGSCFGGSERKTSATYMPFVYPVRQF